MIMDNLHNYQSKDPAGTGRSSFGSTASILKLYSVGRAAANLQVGQTELEVFPNEVKTHTDGEITDHISTLTTSGQDGNGNSYSTSVNASNSIRCKWMSRNGFVKLPGLVRRGEEVLIWRVGDTDQFYWELMGTTNYLRRRDIFIFVVSNTTDESVTELTKDNSYFFEFNTVDKHITLTTATNDGEPVGYTFQINTKDGIVALLDSIGNNIAMDSPNHYIVLKNVDKTKVELTKTVLNINANDQINITTKELNIHTQTTNMDGKQFTGKYDQTDWSGSNMTVKYNALDVTATSTFNGSVKITSGLNAGGGSQLTGGVSTNGNLTNNGTNVGSTHKHGGVQNGPGSTTPPS